MTTVFPTDEFYKQLGANIQRQRKALNIRQEELAAMLGVRRTSVTNIEAGRQKSLVHTIFLIAEILQCDIDDLLPRNLLFVEPSPDVSDVLKSLDGKILNATDKMLLRRILANSNAEKEDRL